MGNDQRKNGLYAVGALGLSIISGAVAVLSEGQTQAISSAVGVYSLFICACATAGAIERSPDHSHSFEDDQNQFSSRRVRQFRRAHGDNPQKHRRVSREENPHSRFSDSDEDPRGYTMAIAFGLLRDDFL